MSIIKTIKFPKWMRALIMVAFRIIAKYHLPWPMSIDYSSKNKRACILRLGESSREDKVLEIMYAAENFILCAVNMPGKTIESRLIVSRGKKTFYFKCQNNGLRRISQKRYLEYWKEYDK
ncbi:MAG: hypothetical protein M1338_01755 [Patescibacteria group bacterium]|nr:hypothetical protein [Patescibacteria group bacterium]